MTNPRTNGVSFTYERNLLPTCLEDRPQFSEPTQWCLDNIGPWNQNWTRVVTTHSNSPYGEIMTVITYYFEDELMALQFKLMTSELQFNPVFESWTILWTNHLAYHILWYSSSQMAYQDEWRTLPSSALHQNGVWKTSGVGTTHGKDLIIMLTGQCQTMSSITSSERKTPLCSNWRVKIR